MPTKSIAWTTGSGNITLTYDGQGDGTIIATLAKAWDIGTGNTTLT